MFLHTCSSVPVTLYLQYVFQIATLKASRPTGSSLFNPGVKEKGTENSLHKHHWMYSENSCSPLGLAKLKNVYV